MTGLGASAEGGRAISEEGGPAAPEDADRAGEAVVRKHLIAVNNTLLGTVNLLVLALPAGWRLGDRGAAPEIDGRTVYGGVAWATAGQAEYALVLGQRRFLRLELHIGHRLPPLPRRLQLETQGQTTAGEHLAAWAAGRARVIAGVFGPAEPVLTLGFFCDHTRRGMRVSVWGEMSPAERAALLAALPGIRCHGPAGEDTPADAEDATWFV